MSEESLRHSKSERRKKKVFWKIYRTEFKKVFSCSSILFFILASYGILRNMKDSLVQSSELNTEAIPYLKNFAVLPFAILITAVFVKLSNIVTREKLFYYIVSAFLSIYLLFVFYLYPNMEELKIDSEKIFLWQKEFPVLTHLFSMMQYWMITLFYVFAELWVSVTGSLLFWQFINDVTTHKESKKFYPIYAFIGHLGPVFSSALVSIISSLYISQGKNTIYCPEYFVFLILLVVFFGVGAMIVFRWMHLNIIASNQEKKGEKEISLGKQKTALPFLKSIKYIVNSRYILFLFLIVFAFGIQNNLMGLLWKKNVELYFNHEKVLISNYNAIFYFTTGIVTGMLTLIFRFIVQRLSWFAGAFGAPVLVAFVCAPYFIILLCSGDIVVHAIGYVATPSYFIVFILSCQQVLNKAVKYGIVDPTKEIAYVPLDRELRYKGKATVDVFGYTMAKSAAGLAVIALFAFHGTTSLMEIAHEIAIICLIVLVGWMCSVKFLNKLYLNISKMKNE